MAKVIEVVYIEEKKGLFKLGQKGFVKLGYARNFLLPKKYAILNNKENKTKIDSILVKSSKREKELQKIAVDVEKKLNNQTITFKAKSHDEGKLYGSISINDILEKVNKTFKTELDKYDLKSMQAIKEVGEYTVPVVIHSDVKITFNIIVESENVTQKKTTKPSKKVTAESENKKDSKEDNKDDNKEDNNKKETSEDQNIENTENANTDTKKDSTENDTAKETTEEK